MWADAVDWDGWEVWTESWGVGFCLGIDTPINQEQGLQARRRRTAYEKTQRLVDLWGPQRCGANWRKNIWAGGAGAQASFMGKCISWQETVQRLPGCLSSEEEGTTGEAEMGMEWRLLCWVMLLSSLSNLGVREVWRAGAAWSHRLHLYQQPASAGGSSARHAKQAGSQRLAACSLRRSLKQLDV